MTNNVQFMPYPDQEHSMTQITFIAYDQCLLSGISGLVDALTISNLCYERFREQKPRIQSRPGPYFTTEIVTAKGRPVTTNCGLRIEPDRPMEAVGETDLILIPPFLFQDQPFPDDIPHILDWLNGCFQKDFKIGAICTGSFILAMTGLLNGKIATTNWQVRKRFRRQFPRVVLRPERVVTEDSGLICSGAVTAQFNLAVYLIELFGSRDLARMCAKAFLVDPSKHSQSPYMITNFRKNHGDREILKAQVWLEENFSRNISIDSAARHVNLSPRHFKRRFKKATHENPLAYLRHIRLEAAKDKLETTMDNIEEITRGIGYEDSSTFRRLFKKYTSLSPRAYRDKFGNRTS